MPKASNFEKEHHTIIICKELIEDIPFGKVSAFIREKLHQFIEKDKDRDHIEGKYLTSINLFLEDLDYIRKEVAKGRFLTLGDFIRTALRDNKYKLSDPLEIIKLPKDYIIIPDYNGNKPVKLIRRLE